jgi:DNA polymerase III alpha subunit
MPQRWAGSRYGSVALGQRGSKGHEQPGPHGVLVPGLEVGEPAVVEVAGLVLVRQRPGTASGVIFSTLEDETGIANIIVRPDLFAELRGTIVAEPYLIVEGTLQIQEGVTSIKAERVVPLIGSGPDPSSHDFR